MTLWKAVALDLEKRLILGNAEQNFFISLQAGFQILQAHGYVTIFSFNVSM